MSRAATDLHPKVKAGVQAGGVLGIVFSILALTGHVVPDDLQNTAAVVATDVGILVPLVAAYVKKEF